MASSTTTASASAELNKTVPSYPLPPVQPPTNTMNGGNPPVASPPPVYLNQLFRNPSRHNRFQLIHIDQILLYRLAVLALSLFVFTGCLTFMLWMIFRSRLPQIHLASVQFAPLLATNAVVSTACNVSLLLTNPNRQLAVVYDNFEIFLEYRPKHVPLAEVQVSKFHQPKRTDTILQTHLEIANATVGNDVVKALKQDLERGWVSFGVKVFVLVRLESKDWKTWFHLMKVSCDAVVVQFSSSNGAGTMLHPYKECQVALWR